MTLSSSSIYVNWSILKQELNGVLHGYQVQVKDMNGLIKVVDVKSPDTSANLTSLLPHMQYQISVRAKTGFGYGPYGGGATQKTEEDGELASDSIFVCTY